MSRLSLRIDAPSRLHFGLLSFGQSSGRQFGGVGVMLDTPGASLMAEPAPQFTVSGPQAERIREFARRWRRYHGAAAPPSGHLRLVRAAPEHVGLGTGTQLGLSVAAALYRMHHQPLPAAAVLAESVGRAARSSVGTYGFLQGGLIWDLGKAAGESLGGLGAREPLPASWRVVLLCPRQTTGLSGSAEKQAFGRLPPVPTAVTERLTRTVVDQLLPAAREGDLETFGEALYAYGYEAGMCFARQQGGPFASRQLAGWIHTLRGRGIRGVGQSSWGPTVFAFTPDAPSAEELCAWVRRDWATAGELQLRISSISQQGARCSRPPQTVGSRPT